MSTSTTTTFYTYPSVSATIFDVPEPKDISGEFEYNYFLADERESTDSRSNRESLHRHRGKSARQVNLSFSPLNSVSPENAVLSEVQLSETEKRRLLMKNTSKITKETEFLGPATTVVKLQDSNVSDRLFADIEATLRLKRIDATALSPTQTVLRYASETSENVDGQAMLDSVDINASNEYVSIDPVTGKEYDVQKVGDINSLTFNAVFSQRFVSDIANTAIKTPLSPAASIFSGVVSELAETQEQARAGLNSNRVIKSSDFVQTFDPIQREKMGLDDVFLGGNTVMGYHIRKYDVDDPDTVDHIYVTNTSADSYADNKIAYGKTYNYSIAVVYLIRVFSLSGRNVVAADVLVESRESPSVNVTCEEIVPPVAPDGLEFYLIQGKELVIEWDFPFNPTDDIKRFQVFRRKSIDEPFELFTELDFDDSTVRTDRYENVPGYVNKALSTPKTSVCDPAFQLDSKYIYAVCSVDAHDLSSGYSEQFMVSYDIFTAKLVVEFISEKNAPKPYPNFLLRSQLTVDAMKDSNHTSLCVYFDPEYLRIFNANGEEVDFLQTSEDEVSYKLQLMHLNFQQNVIANINIK